MDLFCDRTRDPTRHPCERHGRRRGVCLCRCLLACMHVWVGVGRLASCGVRCRRSCVCILRPTSCSTQNAPPSSLQPLISQTSGSCDPGVSTRHRCRARSSDLHVHVCEGRCSTSHQRRANLQVPLCSGVYRWSPRQAFYSRSRLVKRDLVNSRSPRLGCVRALWHVAKLAWITMHERLKYALACSSRVILNVTSADGKGRVARHVWQHENANIGDRHIRRTIIVRREQV